MMTIYKYFTEERHALAFVERGEMMLRPLSWFRSLEDGEVRGDPRDGILTYAPVEGLRLNMQDGRSIIIDGGRFVSSARHHEIFVYCASNQLSADLARRFESPFCVEVEDLERVVALLKARAAPQSRLDYQQVVSGRVNYRGHDSEPGADWALPERLALVKPKPFTWQDEYRIAIGHRGVFDVENVAVTLETGLVVSATPAPSPPPLILRIGRITDFARLHHL